MPTAALWGVKVNEAAWDRKEFDWTGKSFYFITIINIFYKPIGLNAKLGELYNSVRRGGYKTVNDMVLIEYARFKGKIMIEIEKKEECDASVISYQIQTNVDTMVVKNAPREIAGGMKRLAEKVVLKRSLEPRELHYLYIPGGSGARTVLFAMT